MGGGSGSGGGAVVIHHSPQRVTPPTTTTAAVSPVHPVPLGFENWGNTCYANAALQCLLSTALSHALLDPRAVVVFRRYSSNSNLLSKGSGEVDSEDEVVRRSLSQKQIKSKEKEERKMMESCKWLTRELTKITRQYTTAAVPKKKLFGFVHQSNTVVDPGGITKHPNRLCKSLKPYRQEDAHEFLRALLGTLMMNGQNKKLSALFDGLLESAITCQTCRHTSLTRDRYMDLSLDISHDSICTLQDALTEFTKTEVLDFDNRVYCDKCQSKQCVTKGLRLATAPSILVCHFKRFAYDKFGRMRRLHKHVRFPLRLDIGEYMSLANRAKPPPYELVGVLVHQGQSCESGHYLAYVKSGSHWYLANDSQVTQVSVDRVLSQQAYILMYEVAEMRTKNGFSHTSLLDQAKTQEVEAGETSTGFMSMLCETSVINDLICGACNFRHGNEEEEVEVVLDDYTHSTTEESESKVFRKSTSSSNLKQVEKQAMKSWGGVSPRRSRSRGRSEGHRSDPGAGQRGFSVDARFRRKRNSSNNLPPRTRRTMPPRRSAVT